MNKRNKISLGAAGAVLAVASLAVGGSAFAGTSAPPIMKACVSTSGGVMHLTATTATRCPSGQYLVSWNQQGVKGATGASAYAVWLANGHTGTQTQFLSSLKGATGAKGADGYDGFDGASAYELWLYYGGHGTVQDFLAGLKGDAGTNGANGTNGKDGANGTDGKDGQSAYELWKVLADKPAATEADFLASLVGKDGVNGLDGKDGASAFATWKAQDASRADATEVDFLNSLMGAAGKDGTDGTNGANGTDGTNGANGTDGTNGTDGASAFDIWKAADASRAGATEADFLASLKGADGAPGKDGATGADGKDGHSVTVANGTPSTDGTGTTTLTATCAAGSMPIGAGYTLTGTPQTVVSSGPGATAGTWAITFADVVDGSITPVCAG
ncbi:hypothetical protein [Oryzihumus sp.]|uniref:hypothetical protein n=1 Tax=Oryzihumus sp. TaxID=1968903 RepID=UPI002ED9EC2D